MTITRLSSSGVSRMTSFYWTCSLSSDSIRETFVSASNSVFPIGIKSSLRSSDFFSIFLKTLSVAVTFLNDQHDRNFRTTIRYRRWAILWSRTLASFPCLIIKKWQKGLFLRGIWPTMSKSIFLKRTGHDYSLPLILLLNAVQFSVSIYLCKYGVRDLNSSSDIVLFHFVKAKALLFFFFFFFFFPKSQASRSSFFLQLYIQQSQQS